MKDEGCIGCVIIQALTQANEKLRKTVAEQEYQMGLLNELVADRYDRQQKFKYN